MCSCFMECKIIFEIVTENITLAVKYPSGHKIKLATKSKKKKKKILTTLYKLTGNKLKIMD